MGKTFKQKISYLKNVIFRFKPLKNLLYPKLDPCQNIFI